MQTVLSNGTAYTSPFALHLTVEDGLITRYHIYEDSLTVAHALSAQATESPLRAPASANR